MGFWFVVGQIVAVSVPIALGWCLNKLGILDEKLDSGLSRLVLTAALPCSIVASIDGSADLPGAGVLALLMLVTALTYVASVAVGFAISALMRAPRGEAPSYRFAVAFGNCGFIGLPVLSAILGRESMFYAAVALIPVNIAMFSVGPLLFARKEDVPLPKRVRSMVASLKTPTFFASVLVLVLALLGVTDLGVAGDSLAIIGQAATPLALLVTGSSIARYRPLEMLGNPRAYLAAAGRLLVVPIVNVLLVRLFPLDPFLGAVLVLDSAMPVATVGVLFCLQAGSDAKPMAQTTFLTVIGSILSIPVISVLVGA